MKKIFKKVISLVLAVTVVATVFVQMPFASAEETAELNFEIKNGEATLMSVNSTATVIEIPNEFEGVQVTEIHQFAFRTANGITKFIVDENNEYFYADEHGVLFSKDKTTLIKFPGGSDITEYNIPEGVKKFGDRSFANSENLVSVSIPSTVGNISQYTFFNCKKLKNVKIEEGPWMIGIEAFAGCSSLELPAFPESIIIIDSFAFRGCNFSGVVELPAKLSRFGYFSMQQSYMSTVFGDNVAGYSIAQSNTNFSTDENGVLYNKDKTVLYAYPQAAESSSFIVPETVTQLYASAFGGAKNLESIVLSKNITEIGADVFGTASTTLTRVYYEGSESDWETIAVDSTNAKLTAATFYYNYGAVSGTCGDNISWNFNRETGILTVTGSGEMLNLSSVEDYGWYSFKDEIEVVEVGNNIVSVGSNAFVGCSELKEVYLSGTVERLGANAFSNCPNLAILTLYSQNFTAEENALAGIDERFTLFCNSSNTHAVEYAAENLFNCVKISYNYNDKVMNFNGKVTVYDNLPYVFLSKFVKLYPSMKYLYFEKIVFDGVEPEVIDIEKLENDADERFLTFNNLYVSLSRVKDNSADGITFSDFVALLESGDYDAFMFEMKSDEGTSSLTFEELLEKAKDHFVSNALRITAKLVNFFRRLFR